MLPRRAGVFGWKVEGLPFHFFFFFFLLPSRLPHPSLHPVSVVFIMSDVVRGAKVARKSRAVAQAQPHTDSGVADAAAATTAPHQAPSPHAPIPAAAVPAPSPSPPPSLSASASASVASASVRAGAPLVAAAGTRAWINGLTLASTGVQPLDRQSRHDNTCGRGRARDTRMHAARRTDCSSACD